MNYIQASSNRIVAVNQVDAMSWLLMLELNHFNGCKLFWLGIGYVGNGKIGDTTKVDWG